MSEEGSDEKGLCEAFVISGQLYYKWLCRASIQAKTAFGEGKEDIVAKMEESEKYYLYRTGLPVCFFNNVQKFQCKSEEEAAPLIEEIREKMSPVPWVLSVPDSDPETYDVLKSFEGEGKCFAFSVSGKEEFCGMKIDLRENVVKLEDIPREVTVKTQEEEKTLVLSKAGWDSVHSSAETIFVASVPDCPPLGVHLHDTYRYLVCPNPPKGKVEEGKEEEVVEPNHYHIFSYYDKEGKAAATASVMIMPHLKVAYVCEVGTLPEYRKNRLASNLIRQIMLFSREEGCEWAILNSSKLGKSIYERIGFSGYPSGTFSLFGTG